MKFTFGNVVKVVSDSQPFYKNCTGIVVEYSKKNEFIVYTVLFKEYEIKVNFSEDVLELVHL